MITQFEISSKHWTLKKLSDDNCNEWQPKKEYFCKLLITYSNQKRR